MSAISMIAIHNGIKGVRLSAVRSDALMNFLRGQAMLVLPDGDRLVYWDDWQRFVEQQKRDKSR